MLAEDDMEDTGNITVDQTWDLQLKYRISILGKTFPIGGIIPVHIMLMPLRKVKIYRISISPHGVFHFTFYSRCI